MAGIEINPRDLSETGSWSVSAESGRLVYGEGSIDSIGEQVRALDRFRALVVTDRGIRAAGHVERAERSLAAAGVAYSIFDGVVENPTTVNVELGREFASGWAPDCIVALGGGSSMDCAKGINFLYTNGGRMQDYWGTGRATRAMLPSVGVPTTAGTGSEAQSYALISDATTRVKMACGDAKARFLTVILDPSLTPSAPFEVRAVSAIDAASHATESYVSSRRNPVSQLFAREAWRLIDTSLERSLAESGDVGARGRMLLGAHFAGRSIEHSMLGAAHALANPLTARFGLTHGIAVGLMLPHVIRFNRDEVDGLYGELEAVSADAGEPIDRRLERFRRAGRLPATLGEVGVPLSALDQLAADAASQWTANFNPRRVGERELRVLYEAAY
ncbi:MAG TPA: iron-containing alcohol dehydrogenase [Candidatus Polarisedimenticolaceae bacterium]|nr:iron-containing alcohol dehydrogenase [Candidatus Polarisedimenticolaceae bacterium]